MSEARSQRAAIFGGAMRDTVTVAPGVDLTEPTGEVWKADGNAPKTSLSG